MENSDAKLQEDHERFARLLASVAAGSKDLAEAADAWDDELLDKLRDTLASSVSRNDQTALVFGFGALLLSFSCFRLGKYRQALRFNDIEMAAGQSLRETDPLFLGRALQN